MNELCCTMRKEDLYGGGNQEALLRFLQRNMVRMRFSGLVYSDWCGRLDYSLKETFENIGSRDYSPMGLVDEWRIPWITYWEYSKVLDGSKVLMDPKVKVLDLGGAASAFTALIASMGADVTVLDRSPMAKLAEENAKAMGWNLRGVQGDIVDAHELLKGEKFDHVVSISNLFLCGKPAQTSIMEHLHEITAPKARLSFSFDFDNPNPKRNVTDPEDFFRFKGFKVRAPFVDRGERHHVYYPDPSKPKYTAAAIFFERED